MHTVRERHCTRDRPPEPPGACIGSHAAASFGDIKTRAKVGGGHPLWAHQVIEVVVGVLCTGCPDAEL